MDVKQTSVDEKERKFILKRVPINISPTRSLQITQYYKDGLRYRMTMIPGSPDFIFERIKKEKVAVGHNKEVNIEIIDHIDWHKNRTGSRQDRHEIHKTRHEYEFEGKKFEVDVFHDLTLVMMEVENVELNEEIYFPPEIKDVILCEVTGNELCDNYNLGG